MKLIFRIIIALLFYTVQLAAQVVEPDTIVVSQYDVTRESLHPENDSIQQHINHPADSIYQNSWNHTNITYSSVKLAASYDTLLIALNSNTENKFVRPTNGKVISGFGTARRPSHTGTDIKLNAGDTVRCAFDGQVRLARRFSGYGNMVLVRHNNGLETVYGHLSKINVKENQYLKAGDLLGLGGRTGRATTDHLHFETRMLGVPFNAEKIIDFGKGQLINDTFYYHNAHVAQQIADLRTVKKPVYADETGETIQYSIRSGDTLSSIARMFGTSIRAICQINSISPQKILQIGARLIIQP